MKGIRNLKEAGTSESVYRCQHLIKLLPPPNIGVHLVHDVFKEMKSMRNLPSISESHKCYIWYPELGSKNFMFTVFPFL